MKILVVDDYPLVRDAMAELVTHLGGSVDVVQAPDCGGALALARVHPDLDLVLLDLNLPGLRGIPALQRFRREHPSAPVVVISASRDRETIAQVIRHGAVGFIPKSSGRDTIVNALRLVLAGSVYIPREAALPDEPEDAPMRAALQGRGASAAELGLTPRQAQVLALLMKGRANKEICRDLGLAERTVKAHLSAVLNVLKATSRTQAVIAANRLGLDIEVLLASQ
jgi:DNA-binding NarL/FixJ family response regulator